MRRLITVCIFRLEVLLVYPAIKVCKSKGVQSLRKPLQAQSSLRCIKMKEKNMLAKFTLYL